MINQCLSNWPACDSHLKAVLIQTDAKPQLTVAEPESLGLVCAQEMGGGREEVDSPEGREEKNSKQEGLQRRSTYTHFFLLSHILSVPLMDAPVPSDFLLKECSMG